MIKRDRRWKACLIWGICMSVCFVVGRTAVSPVLSAAPADKSSPRFVTHNRASGATALTKRSGRSVMWSSPIDWDGDGDLDLIADQRVYENVGGGVFRKGPLLSFLHWRSYICLADLNGDGRWDIVDGGEGEPEIRLHLNTGRPGEPTFGTAQTLVSSALFESARPAGRKPLARGAPFVADWNGDGLPDLLVGTRDIWTDYFAYPIPGRFPPSGRTSFGQIHGELYFLPNHGTRTQPRFPRVEPLLLDGHPLTVFGICSPTAVDWDEDGDLDLLVTQESFPVLYFENVGSSAQPKLAQPRHLYIEYPGIYSKVSVVDWDGDGLFDLLASSEDGEFLFRNAGKPGEPYFSGTFEAFRETAAEVWTPGFSTPDAVDYDGDGDLDLVVGSDDGEFHLFRNIGTRKTPVLAEGELLRFADGKPLRIVVETGYQPQGPVERFWGYSSPSLVDWDGDGDLDLLSGQIGRSGYLLFQNEGGRRAPVWAEPRLLEAAGKIIRTRGHARVRPAPVDWNEDGLMDLVAVNDRYGYTLYLRKRDETGALLLQAGTPLAFQSGAPVVFSKLDNPYGQRDKPNVYDWDGDGDWDILAGLLFSAPVLFLENVGSNEKPIFAEGKEITDLDGVSLRKQGRELLEGWTHTPNIEVADWNGDGVPDLLAGQDMGFVLFFDGTTLSPKPRKR